MKRQQTKIVFLVMSLVVMLFGLLVTTIYAHESEQDDVSVIHMYEDRYEPQDITITAGDTVVFENESNVERWPASNIHPTHRGYPDSDIENCSTEQERFMFDACRGIKPGNTYTFQFNEVGEWRYHDHVAPDIRGNITVVPADDKSEINLASESSVSWWRAALASFFNSISSWLLGEQIENSTASGTKGSDSPAQALSTPTYDDTIELETRAIATDTDLIYSHVKKFGAEATLLQLQSMENEFGSCHDNAHYVGRYAYELFGADAFNECAMTCQSGCYHGTVEEFFRTAGTANLGGSINELCNEQTNSFIEHQCNHGVGHGLLAWTNYQLFDALESCDLLESPISRESCYSGVFMENIVQSMAEFLGIEGHTTEYLSDDPHFPCSVVEEQYKPVCYFLQTDRMYTLFDGDFAAVANECGTVDDFYARSNCFQSLGRTVGGENRQESSGANRVCQAIEVEEDRIHCLTGVIQNLMWDKEEKPEALAFCRLLTRPTEKDLCYNLIIERAFAVMSEHTERKLFCTELEFAYQTQCREQIL